MKKQLLISILPLFIFGMGINKLNAQTPFSPNSYAGWVSTPTNSFATIPAAPGVLFTQVTRGAGNTFSTAADGINSSKWNNPSVNAAIAANQYLTFSVSSNSTTTFEIDSISLVLGRSNAGPDSCILQYKLTSSGNNFTSVAAGVRVILNPTSNPTTTLSIIPLSPITSLPSDTVVFRLVAWHATSTLGTMKLMNNTTVYGKIIAAVTNSIAAPVVQMSSNTCVSALQGDSVQVTFSSTGVFNAGNTYTLELSDALGNFTAPLVIGSNATNLNTGTIHGFIPAGTASANYQLRIQSSNPVIAGLDTTHLMVHPGMLLSASVLQPNCPDSTGEIDLTITGGSGMIQYSWSNSESTQDLNNLAGGTYAVTITDAAGCLSDSSFNIQSVQSFAVTDSISPVYCHSESTGLIELIVSGATAPYSISWSGNGISQTGLLANNLAAGTYSVSILDANNCSYSNTYVVNEPDSIVVSAFISPATCSSCNGSVSLSVAGGVAPYSFDWDNNSTLQNISAIPGTYCVTISDMNACESDTCFSISSTAGLADEATGSEIHIFPNPATDAFQVVFPQSLYGTPKKITILNSLGEIVFEKMIDSATEQETIHVESWTRGIYLYQIRNGNEGLKTGKINLIN